MLAAEGGADERVDPSRTTSLRPNAGAEHITQTEKEAVRYM